MRAERPGQEPAEAHFCEQRGEVAIPKCAVARARKHYAFDSVVRFFNVSVCQSDQCECVQRVGIVTAGLKSNQSAFLSFIKLPAASKAIGDVPS